MDPKSDPRTAPRQLTTGSFRFDSPELRDQFVERVQARFPEESRSFTAHAVDSDVRIAKVSLFELETLRQLAAPGGRWHSDPTTDSLNTSAFRMLCNGSGEAVGRSLREAVLDSHAVLEVAAAHQLDVNILTGSLVGALRDQYETAVAGSTFADKVEGVIKAGGSVKILVCSDRPADSLVSNELALLLLKYWEPQPGKGTLEVRACEANATTHHFIVATNPQRDEWLLRVEAPHGAPQAPLSDTFPIQSAVFRSTETVRASGPQFLDIFEKLFDRAGERGRSLSGRFVA